MNPPTTLTELFLTRTAKQPHRNVLTYLESFGAREIHLTYADLDGQARSIAAHLQTLAPPGSRAIMLYPPGIDSVPAFFGALYAGLVPVPVVPPRPGQPPATMARILADAQSNLILTTASSIQRVQQQFGNSELAQTFQWVATDKLAAQTPPPFTPVPRQPDDIAVLLYTSGSTSHPKGVMLSHANILGHMHATYEFFNPMPGEHMVMWTPLYHGGGLIGSVLDPMYANVEVTILSPLEVLERPGYWLESISRTHANISSGANFLYQWCVDRTTPAERAALDLSSWRIAFCGAEPIRAPTLKRFAETFAPHGFHASSFCAAYGQTETTLLTTFRYGGIPPALNVSRQAIEQGEVKSCCDCTCYCKHRNRGHVYEICVMARIA